ncbi:MAG: hypothetical protein GF416_03475 [Candidatus Altiarchaeales archaeon]|nr:hypothetical protein [Candidatus Altiarchaeales archaeon]MBD3416180.1 hypothetical protein [Candidatus Altiarchaeales archaeon]
MRSFPLKFTVFSAGASVMVVEILASRIMAPYYGSSTFVWSALIAVVLASLSVGYYVGGRLADMNPTVKTLSRILVLSSVFIGLIPFFKEPVLLACYFLMGLKAGSIAASAILLSVPAVLLGTVSPYAIKLSARDLKGIGTTSGDIYALSTVGSIVGTLAAGFLLIPYLPLSTVFYSVSVTLLASSILLHFSSWRVDQVILLVLMAGLMLFFREPYVGGRQLLHMEYSPYNRIIVEEDDHNRYMYLDGRSTGAMVLSTGFSLYEYAHYFEIPFLLKPDIGDVLFVGGGSGVGVKQVVANHPSASVTVSEIDPRVYEASHEYFYQGMDDSVDVRLMDARMIVKDGGEYDYVVFDVFTGRNAIPNHLVTSEFFADVSRSTSDDAIILLNVISSVEGSRSLVLKSVLKTVSPYFPHAKVYPLHSVSIMPQNVIVIASKKPLPSDGEVRARIEDTRVLSSSKLHSLLDRELKKPLSLDGGVMLTDEHNPVDQMYAEVWG